MVVVQWRPLRVGFPQSPEFDPDTETTQQNRKHASFMVHTPDNTRTHFLLYTTQQSNSFERHNCVTPAQRWTASKKTHLHVSFYIHSSYSPFQRQSLRDERTLFEETIGVFSQTRLLSVSPNLSSSSLSRVVSYISQFVLVTEDAWPWYEKGNFFSKKCFCSNFFSKRCVPWFVENHASHAERAIRFVRGLGVPNSVLVSAPQVFRTKSQTEIGQEIHLSTEVVMWKWMWGT